RVGGVVLDWCRLQRGARIRRGAGCFVADMLGTVSFVLLGRQSLPRFPMGYSVARERASRGACFTVAFSSGLGSGVIAPTRGALADSVAGLSPDIRERRGETRLEGSNVVGASSAAVSFR